MTLFERVRAALASDYEVRAELGRGGMGVVYDAVDRRLEKRVAVKVLLPEMATARAVARFLREARGLAAVEHPCVLRVHRAGEAGGLYYYVMEHVDGETLSERLRRGPLDGTELRGLVEDLLSALEAIHGAGIIHRDLKPSNIFLVEDRALLGDFGISLPRESPPEDRITTAGEVVGTPGYLAPEQLWGDATRATDVHGAALVIYEACTGRSWREGAGMDAPWSDVPRHLRGPLRRALDPEPGRRPEDAAAFSAALSGRNRRRWVAGATVAVLTALLLAAGYLAGWSRPSAAAADLAILPLEVVGAAEAGLGRDLATRLSANLEGLPRMAVVPGVASRAGPGVGSGRDTGVVVGEDGARHRISYFAGGTVSRLRGSVEVRLVVENAVGQRLREMVVVGSPSDLDGVARSAARELINLLQPRLAPEYRGLEGATDDFQALRELWLGEAAFHQNAWTLAEEHYEAALAADPACALARWRLWNVWRWRLSGREIVDLHELQREGAGQLPAIDRALLAAETRPAGAERLAALAEVALVRYPESGNARLLYADELYHRGPLVGRPLEEAAAQFAEASALDPSSGPAYEHGLLALLRLGLEDEARRVHGRLQETAAPPAPDEVLHYPSFLGQAMLERFDPDAAVERRAALFDFGDPEQWPGIAFAARMGLAVDVPEAQRALGRGLTVAPGAPPSLRANGHMAQGLALMVLGRPSEALPQLDSASALLGTAEAELLSAEWRVLLPAMGVAGIPASEVERGRERIERTAQAPTPLMARAAWALALHAFAAGDTAAGQAWRARIGDAEARELSGRLGDLADAFGAFHGGRPERALMLTRPLLDDQFLPRDGDPFTRAALHLIRARAFEALGDVEAARRERLWAENQDIARVLEGPVQAVEVDWVVSPHSDRRRVRLAMEAGDTAAACRLLDRIGRLWADSEPVLDSLRAADRERFGGACP